MTKLKFIRMEGCFKESIFRIDKTTVFIYIFVTLCAVTFL